MPDADVDDNAVQEVMLLIETVKLLPSIVVRVVLPEKERPKYEEAPFLSIFIEGVFLMS